MIPFQLIQLTDGTTTLTLNDNISYGVSSYAPAIAPRILSQIGGNAPYEAVEEKNLTVTVMGQTAIQALNNLVTLWQLCDRSARWYAGENVPPVRLRVLVQCSSLTQPISALVWAPDGQEILDLSPTYDQTIGKWLISGVSIDLMRMGQWQNDTLASATSSAVAAALAMPVTFSSPGTNPMPTRIQIKPSAGVTSFPGGLIAITDAVSYVRVDDLSTTGAYGVVTSDTSAYNGAFVRYTSVPANTTFTLTLPTASFGGAFADIWIVVRNPGTSAWRINASVIRAGDPSVLAGNTVATGPSNPQIVYLGAGVTDSATDPALSLTITNLGAASANFDIDYAFWVARRPSLGISFPITATMPITDVIALNTVAATGSTYGYTIDPWCLNRGVSLNLLTAADRPAASVYVGQTSDNFGANWRGNAFLTTIGTTPSAYLFVTDGANWRPMNGAALHTWAATMERRETYLTPQ